MKLRKIMLLLTCGAILTGFTGTSIIARDLKVMTPHSYEEDPVYSRYRLKDLSYSHEDYNIIMYLLKKGFIGEKDRGVRNILDDDIYYVMARYHDIKKGTSYTVGTFNRDLFRREVLSALGAQNPKSVEDLERYVHMLE